MSKLWARLVLAFLLSATAASAEDSKCKVIQFAELKVTMVGNEPTVGLKINGVPVRFTVDSGAFYSTINTATARQLKLPLDATNLQVKGVAGVADTYVTKADTVELAGAKIERVPFVVAAFGGSTDGLLGQNVLGIADVEYDLPHGAIRLFKPQNCGRMSMAYWANGRAVAEIAVEPRDDYQHHTIGHGRLNGKDLKIMFDTGASTSFIALGAAARVGVHPGDPGVTNGGQTGGIGGRLVTTYVGRFDTFSLDTEEVRNIKIRFGEMDLSADMLLGEDFFISHRVYVSNAQRRLFITYEGGPIFSTTARALDRDPLTKTERTAAAPKDSGSEPQDADGFARRGAARLSANEIALALADLDKAVQAAPESDEDRLLRAKARLANHQPFLALADLDTVLERHGTDAEARMLRAEIRISEGKSDPARLDLARSDLAAADSALAPEADLRLTLARLYSTLDVLPAASTAYSQWLQAHPDHPHRGAAYAGRCRSQALLGQDLDRAVGDCNRALDATPREATALEGRGLVRLRQGKAALALKDLDLAVEIQPKWPEAQYLRGLARQACGQTAEGHADQITAEAANPSLVPRMKALGLDALPARPATP